MARTEGKQQSDTQSRQEDERNRSLQQGTYRGGQRQSALSQRRREMPSFFMSPFSFMRRFGEDMEELFGDFGGESMGRGFGEMATWMPQIEVFQREGEFVICADLPGLKKDDVQVDVRDESVVLQGERREERKEEHEGVYRTERSYGRFYREIPLPENVDPDKAMATFRDGVLEIMIPVEEGATRGRRLQIEDSKPGEQTQGEQTGPGTQAAGAGR